MTLHISIVCTSISGLTVAGVTILDVDKIPPSAYRLLPLLLPSPQLVTNFTTSRMTFGPGANAEKEAEYDLNYVFVYTSIGEGRTGLDHYQEMVELAEDVVEEILENDVITGAVDISPQGGLDFGPITDPSGNNYLGCNMAFHVVDYLHT